MFVTKKHLDRRTFLRGAFGTAIALPLLAIHDRIPIAKDDPVSGWSIVCSFFWNQELGF
jgi:hypothetical protein